MKTLTLRLIIRLAICSALLITSTIQVLAVDPDLPSEGTPEDYDPTWSGDGILPPIFNDPTIPPIPWTDDEWDEYLDELLDVTYGDFLMDMLDELLEDEEPNLFPPLPPPPEGPLNDPLPIPDWLFPNVPNDI